MFFWLLIMAKPKMKTPDQDPGSGTRDPRPKTLEPGTRAHDLRPGTQDPFGDNHRHNILRILINLPNILLTTSETKRGY